MSKRAFVFIDGSNFYFKLKELTSKSQSYGLSNVADDVRLLRPEEIEQFLSKISW